MTGDIVINGPTAAMLGGVWLVLSGVIVKLFGLVNGRMIRAETQVDTLLPINQALVEQMRGLREDLAKQGEQLRDVREALIQEQGRRRNG